MDARDLADIELRNARGEPISDKEIHALLREIRRLRIALTNMACDLVERNNETTRSA